MTTMWKKFFNSHQMENHPARGITICLLCKGRHFPGSIVPVLTSSLALAFPSVSPPLAGQPALPGHRRRGAGCPCRQEEGCPLQPVPGSSGARSPTGGRPQPRAISETPVWAPSPGQGRARSHGMRWVRVLGTAVGCSQGAGFSAEPSLPRRLYAPFF